MEQDKIYTILAGELRKRLIEEGITRLRTCVGLLNVDQLHHRDNSHCNSIVNLIYHLDGNVRQWLIAVLMDTEDIRERDQEFAHDRTASRSDLAEILDGLERAIDVAVDRLSQYDLTAERDVQVYQESYLSVIIHVIEHFSYHVGQVTHMTKSMLDVDTGYYADHDL